MYAFEFLLIFIGFLQNFDWILNERRQTILKMLAIAF